MTNLGWRLSERHHPLCFGALQVPQGLGSTFLRCTRLHTRPGGRVATNKHLQHLIKSGFLQRRWSALCPTARPRPASTVWAGTSGGFRGWLNACLWTQKKIPESASLCFYCPVFDSFPVLITNVPQARCQAEGLSQVAGETVGATEPLQQSHHRQAKRSQAQQQGLAQRFTSKPRCSRRRLGGLRT